MLECEDYGGGKPGSGFGIDAGGSKGERETKDHLEKDCREGESQSRVKELECGQGSGMKQRVLGKVRDSLMHLLARREMMMMKCSKPFCYIKSAEGRLLKKARNKIRSHATFPLPVYMYKMPANLLDQNR